jgi:ABC-2 type transport system permease protein
MASSFILYRNANALSNLLEYPVWVATGLLFPVTLLPSWVGPISWLLAPRWGIDAIRHSATGGGPVWFPIGMCVVVGAAYLVLAALFLRVFEREARARATLSLT